MHLEPLTVKFQWFLSDYDEFICKFVNMDSEFFFYFLMVESEMEILGVIFKVDVSTTYDSTFVLLMNESDNNFRVNWQLCGNWSAVKIHFRHYNATLKYVDLFLSSPHSLTPYENVNTSETESHCKPNWFGSFSRRSGK